MCGIVGIFSQQSASYQIYDALLMLQHRGQDAAGILTASGNQMYRKRGKGLISEVFADAHSCAQLQGTIGIGHVRYPTAGDAHSLNAQPLDTNVPCGIALAHNGNIVPLEGLCDADLDANSKQTHAKSDSEILLAFFSRHMRQAMQAGQSKKEAVCTACKAIQKQVTGAFSLVILVVGVGLVALRDKFGIRPLALGKRNNDYLVASESVALDVLDFEYLRDIYAGEILLIEESGAMTTLLDDEAQLTPCLFEYVYLARPDSRINDVDVAQARMNMGVHLAHHIQKYWHHLAIDTVIPVPDTSRTAACELARVLHLPHREGFIKNRYIGRTFIASADRERLVRRKLNPIRREFAGKNVLLVDDSIVRGTTSRQIVRMVRRCGAKKVYLCSAAPEVRFQNIYGIDMPTKEELVVNQYKDHADLTRAMGVDALIYQSLDGLITSVQECNPLLKTFEASVFTGKYITADVDDAYLQRWSHNRLQQQLQFGFAV